MVDTTTKANRKCEYCEHWVDSRCKLKDVPKHYWNSCKQFQWRACYVSPENVEARKRLKVDKLVKALEKKEQEIVEAEKLVKKLQADCKSICHEMVMAKRDLYGTKNVKVGDTLYYIDYEVSGCCYIITQEISVENDDYIKPGDYFVVKPEGLPSKNGFVRVEEVNNTRFFTSPEKAHKAFAAHKTNQ